MGSYLSGVSVDEMLVVDYINGQPTEQVSWQVISYCYLFLKCN